MKIRNTEFIDWRNGIRRCPDDRRELEELYEQWKEYHAAKRKSFKAQEANHSVGYEPDRFRKFLRWAEEVYALFDRRFVELKES